MEIQSSVEKMGPPPLPSSMDSAGNRTTGRKIDVHHNRSESRSASRTRSAQGDPEVLVPPFKLPSRSNTVQQSEQATENVPINMDAGLQKHWSLSSDGNVSVVREVHKIVLSNVNTVEFFHNSTEQIAQRVAAPMPSSPMASPSPISKQEFTESGKAKTKGLKPSCVYRVEYRDTNDTLLHSKQGDTPEDVAHPRPVDEAVIEIVTTIEVSPHSKDSERPFSPELARGKDLGTKLKINSLPLINALRAVVDYYPYQSLHEEPLTFAEPYHLLVHHRRQLSEYKSRHPPAHTPEYVEECNQHIDILLAFLKKKFEGGLEAEEERHQRDPPMCTFEFLWMLFPPGTDIYAIADEAPIGAPRRASVVRFFRGGHIKNEFKQYDIFSWILTSNGEHLIKTSSSSEILPFDGEKPIRSLNVFPFSYLEEKQRTTIEKHMIARGKRYYTYMTISHKHFRGYTMFHSRRLYDAEVILDALEFLEGPSDHDFFSPIDEEIDKMAGVCGCNCVTCGKTKHADSKVRFSGYDKIPMKKPLTELTDHQFMLCNPAIFGFLLQQKSWQLLDMDGIRDVSFRTESINDLVLDPEENKTILKALAKRYTQKPADVEVMPPVVKDNVTVFEPSSTQSGSTWSADFIEGKGEGQIILLHGPPGVGKTCTAESLAAYVERPLLSLSCSDIGTESTAVDSALMGWMKRARRWGAILLIDEADIYLEERSVKDFQRNSLVSVFLRNLEYYKGIMFLTTNRVGTFDEAFASRIHLSLQYPGFDDAKRIKVWNIMIKRLERERKDIRVDYYLKTYVEKDEDLKKVKWNGREIRNAFQTAVALAEYHAAEEKADVIELKIDFLRQVVTMSGRFKEYLSTLPDGNVEKKALKFGKRNDAFTNE